MKTVNCAGSWSDVSWMAGIPHKEIVMTENQSTNRRQHFQRPTRERIRRLKGEQLSIDAVERRRRITQHQQQRGLGYAQAEQEFDSGRCGAVFVPIPEELHRWEDDGGAGSGAREKPGMDRPSRPRQLSRRRA